MTPEAHYILQSLGPVIAWEIKKRCDCPDLARDMQQNAWLDLINDAPDLFSAKSDYQALPYHQLIERFRWVIRRSISHYFWSQALVVSQKRPRKAHRNRVQSITMDDVAPEHLPMSVPPDQAIEKGQYEQAMSGFFEQWAQSNVSDRDWHVVKQRFLAGKKPVRRNVIGTTLGVSSERVRQIESRALNRIRNAMTQSDDAMLKALSASVNQ